MFVSLVKKIFFGLLLLSLFANAYDNLVKNESYFKKAIQKSKLNDFSKNRVIAILY